MALKHLTTIKNPGVHVERMLGRIQQYDFDVEHRDGVRHGNADGLSRAPHHPQLRDEDVPDHDTIGIANLGEGESPAESIIRNAKHDPS